MLLGRMRPPEELEFRVAFSELGLRDPGKLRKFVRLSLYMYVDRKYKIDNIKVQKRWNKNRR